MGCGGASSPGGCSGARPAQALIALPLLLYTGYVFLTNDILGKWSAQNQLPSPNPLHYVFGYIVLAIPAVVGFRWAWRKSAAERRLPTCCWRPGS